MQGGLNGWRNREGSTNSRFFSIGMDKFGNDVLAEGIAKLGESIDQSITKISGSLCDSSD